MKRGLPRHEILIELGFIENNDERNDPRGLTYDYKNKHFHICIDAWGDVQLFRLNPDSDPVTIKADTVSDLENLISFIAES